MRKIRLTTLLISKVDDHVRFQLIGVEEDGTKHVFESDKRPTIDQFDNGGQSNLHFNVFGVELGAEIGIAAPGLGNPMLPDTLPYRLEPAEFNQVIEVPDRLSGFPAVWTLLRFVFSAPIRERVFDPSFEVLLEDYLESRARFTSRGARLWLAFCFSARTIWLVLQCTAVAWKALFWAVVVLRLPDVLRELIESVIERD